MAASAVKTADGLSSKTYPGRVVGVGMTPNNTPFVVYGLTGRSKSSKARKLALEPKGRRLMMVTKPTDMSALQQGNVALLIYPVMMADDGRRIVISNGAQTPLALKGPLPVALMSPHKVHGIDVTSYEPDEPNFTPRITAELARRERHWLSTFLSVRRSDGGHPLMTVNQYELVPGVARLLPTYAGGNEKERLLPFIEDPIRMDITANDPRLLCEHLYAALRGVGPEDYRVSAAVVTLSPGKRVVTAGVAIINASDNPDSKASLSGFHLKSVAR